MSQGVYNVWILSKGSLGMQEEDEILTALQRLEEMHVSVETLKVNHLPVGNGSALAYLRGGFCFLQGYCFDTPFNK